ncbi:MAG: hypothetical protein KW793_00050 [Candidatus Doudnabacteria bacterium]|nr:hypothetical protein [Candidatus Doudnabacteria bacterium]
MNTYSMNRGVSGSGIGGALLGFVGGVVVWALFGDRIKQKVNQSRAYQEMKAEVMDKVSSVKEMSQTRYNQIVDEVSAVYSKAKGIRQNELNDLVSDLKFHWARIKDRWNEPPSNNNTTGTRIAGSDPNINDGFNFDQNN